MFDAVFMMDRLVGMEGALKVLFHNPTVLRVMPAIDADGPITISDARVAYPVRTQRS
jgi:hypothetical protein